jgi:hypothetical protein
VITCNHCGRPTPAGMAQCQYCGNLVTGPMSGGGGAKMGTPELPAWLETLKAGERSSSSPPGLNASSGYSADDFVDESLLPSWMQSERNDVADNNPSDAIPLRRPASTVAPNTDDAFIPTKGMSASSFIDEQFLPPWLKEKQAATSNTPPESIAASSLLQQDALPDWMRAVPPPAQVQPPPVPSPMPYNQPTNTPQGIAGNDLIDQQAVPEWMAAQNTEVTRDGQAGFAASSLIDRDGLPSWMREGNQEQKKSSAEAFPPQQAGFAQPSHSQLPPVQGQVPYQPQPTSQTQAPSQQQQPNNQPMNASLSAASFIDVNALPEWLRAPSTLPAPLQPGTTDNQRQFGVPQRPEHVRVPSRPRNEQGSSEESAVAANAFASMLGVASAVPFFPGQQQRDASMGQATMPPQPAQSVLPVSINNGGGAPGTSGTSSPPMSTATWGAPPVQPMYVSQPGQAQPNQGFAAGQSQSPTEYQNGYMINSIPGALPQQPAAANFPGMVSPSNSGQSKTNTKPAKRGFLSTILDWFSRSS